MLRLQGNLGPCDSRDWFSILRVFIRVNQKISLISNSYLLLLARTLEFKVADSRVVAAISGNYKRETSVETYLLILVIALLLNLVGFIWLVVVGFKRSIVWGILIFLFSPITAIAFAITNWFDARNSFLLYIVSTLAIVVSLYLFFFFVSLERIEKISLAIESGQIKEN